MISQTVEYSLRAIVTIAQNEGVPCTSLKISALTQVPAPYLSKLMQWLVRAELVTSKRGLHGGFVLTKQPTELTIWDVVQAVEPSKRILECPLGIHGTNLCPLHRRLDDALAMVEESLKASTIAELLDEPGAPTPLCREPVVQLDISMVEPKEPPKKEPTKEPPTKEPPTKEPPKKGPAEES